VDKKENPEQPSALRVVVLYSAGHLGSTMILNRLLDMPAYKVVGVIKARAVAFSPAGIRKVKRQLKKVGWRFAWLLLWQRLVQAGVFLVTLLLPRSEKRLRPAWKIAEDLHIPVLKCDSINGDQAITFMADLTPDLLLSAYFPQILKDRVIGIPRLGVLNVHPGWLPAYKGAMAYFWVLKNGSDCAGVTVHWIDEGVDTGEIIARRSFCIEPGMTQQNVLVTTAATGADLLALIGEKLLAGRSLSSIRPEEDEADHYYPMPGESAFDSYFRQRRFFRIRDTFASIFRGRVKNKKGKGQI
jgi:folate-dependent phosphoribosylglycinamide formyltransferase PurN